MADNDTSGTEFPREQQWAPSPGSYEAAIRLNTQIIDPGDEVRLQVFFTGYGEISRAKLFFFASDSIFDQSQSWIRTGIKLVGHEDAGSQGFEWGAQRVKYLCDWPMIVFFTGLQMHGWAESTCFFDVKNQDSDRDQNIATEGPSGGFAPFELELRTLREIKPGKYYFEFCFTYYDGQKWRSSSKKVDFTVRSFIERHQQKIAAWGVVASILGLGLGGARVVMSFDEGIATKETRMMAPQRLPQALPSPLRSGSPQMPTGK